ncbi:flagellar motor switch protein FliN [Acidiphilium sp. MT5]
MSSNITEAGADAPTINTPGPAVIAAPVTASSANAHHDGFESVRPSRELDAVYDIPVLVSAVLGRATMQVSQILKLGRGAVVELDRKVGDPIDVFVNNRLVARGEIVIIEGTRLGITMTEIVKSDRAG